MHRLLLVLAGMALGSCAVNTTGAKCERGDVNCPLGEGCGLDGRCSPAALCPQPGSALGQVCTPGSGSPPSCGLADTLKRCDPSPVSLDCHVWTQIDCAEKGLYCDASATTDTCACPALGGTDDVFADAIGGSLLLDPVPPTGLETPALCRFKSVTEALLQTGSGTGHMVVRATGWTGPAGPPVIFAEAGPISIPAGVTLTTSDAPLTTNNYVLQAPDTGPASSFVSLAAGATLSGWEVRNESATADAIGTNCGTGTAMVIVDSVKVSGTGPGVSPAKFKAGIHFSDNLCSLSVNAATISGVSDTAILLDGGGPSVSLTNNVITGNSAASVYTISPSIERRGGGIVVWGTIPSSFVFHGNQVYGNQGDQILVGAGSGALNLTGGAASGACGVTSNVIRCYDASTSGKGVYAAGPPLEVKVDYNEWPTAFPNKPVDAFGNVTGLGSWCDPVASRPACP
jgi:hypothetical protein